MQECKNKVNGCNHKSVKDGQYCLSCQIATERESRYTIYKVRNGCWKLEWSDGSFSEHSTQGGAERMRLHIEAMQKSPHIEQLVRIPDKYPSNGLIGEQIIDLSAHKLHCAVMSDAICRCDMIPDWEERLDQKFLSQFHSKDEAGNTTINTVLYIKIKEEFVNILSQNLYKHKQIVIDRVKAERERIIRDIVQQAEPYDGSKWHNNLSVEIIKKIINTPIT